MLIDPISGLRMFKARARGGTIWYGKNSRSRLLTVAVAKKFFGEDGAREIWIRSGMDAPLSEYKCPSCHNNMKLTKKPRWLQGGEIDVCRRCHLIWIKPDEHIEVPHPEDLLSERGDSTIAGDIGKDLSKIAIIKHEEADESSKIIGDGPDSAIRKAFSFLLLPVEMSDHGYPSRPYITWFLILLAIAMYSTVKDPVLIKSLGIYPGDVFRNYGLNIYAGMFLHAGFLHLIGNLYFFNMFSDDVEFDLGWKKFLVFLLLTPLVSVLIMSLLSKGANRDVAHIGLSGLNMALMVYYSLQFPKSRLAYVFPAIHYMALPGGGGSFLRAWRWIRVRVYVVVGLYFLVDLAHYYFINPNRVGGVSYSGHVAGAITGFFMWLILSIKPDPGRDREITGEMDLTPGHRIRKYIK